MWKAASPVPGMSKSSLSAVADTCGHLVISVCPGHEQFQVWIENHITGLLHVFET